MQSYIQNILNNMAKYTPKYGHSMSWPFSGHSLDPLVFPFSPFPLPEPAYEVGPAAVNVDKSG